MANRSFDIYPASKRITDGMAQHLTETGHTRSIRTFGDDRCECGFTCYLTRDHQGRWQGHVNCQTPLSCAC